MLYEIETNIRMPLKKENELKATFGQMNVGDSIKILNRKSSITGYAYQAAKELGIKVACRKLDAETIRIWRTK